MHNESREASKKHAATVTQLQKDVSTLTASLNQQKEWHRDLQLHLEQATGTKHQLTRAVTTEACFGEDALWN